MKLRIVLLAALVVLAGCATPVQKREALLTTSGFRTKPAATPEQVALLGRLPTDQISAVNHRGKVLFVYPDPKRNLLYVGTSVEYAAYKKARDEQKLAVDQQTATFQQEAKWADMDGWKGLSDGWYNF